MKELKDKKHIIITVLLVIAVFWVVIKVVYKPIAEKKENVIAETAKIDKVDEKKLEEMEINLVTQNEKAIEAKAELDRLYEIKQFGYLDYTKMMDYLGTEANKFGVDIITLKKVEARQNGNHYEVPYYVNVKAKYEDLLMFVDSLYQIENYLEIQAFKLNQRPSSEAQEITANDNSSEYMDWMTTFSERLNKDLNEYEKKKVTAGTTETAGQENTATTTEKANDFYEEFAKLQVNKSDVLDLEMEMFFISLNQVHE